MSLPASSSLLATCCTLAMECDVLLGQSRRNLLLGQSYSVQASGRNTDLGSWSPPVTACTDLLVDASLLIASGDFWQLSWPIDHARRDGDVACSAKTTPLVTACADLLVDARIIRQIRQWTYL